MKKKVVFQSRFFCTRCGREGIPLSRNFGKSKEPGHLKNLYCIYCKEETNHVEIRPFGDYHYDDFIKEFNGHNFDENGKRKEEYKQFLKGDRQCLNQLYMS